MSPGLEVESLTKQDVIMVKNSIRIPFYFVNYKPREFRR